MDRDEFMDIVYSELESDPDNNRANRIIEAADEYATDKNVGTNDDCISRQAAIEALGEQPLAWEQGEYEDGLIAKWESDVEAIKNLPSGTNLAEVGTDCISRRRAIDAVVDELDVMDAPKWAYDSLEGRLKQLPPVTPKQRTGYWYPVGMAEAVGGESAQWGSAIAYHKCSECDEQALRDDFEQEVLSDFCPHCGAKMRGTLWE